MRILWIDDEPQVIQAAKTSVKSEGFDFHCCYEGYAGLTRAMNEYFDVIVLDMLMPGLSGIGVLQGLRAGSIATPVLVLTGFGDSFAFASGSLGAVAYRQKPLIGTALANTIRHAAALLTRVTWAPPAQLTRPQIGAPKIEFPRTYQSGSCHLQRALEVIARRFREPTLSRAIIASEVGIHPDHLRRLFKRYLGARVMDLVHGARVDEAERLLESTTDSVYVIALECGYRSTGILDTHFKRLKGRLPTSLRQV
jgi:YesN/AraC family two-component response regulator